MYKTSSKKGCLVHCNIQQLNALTFARFLMSDGLRVVSVVS